MFPEREVKVAVFNKLSIDVNDVTQLFRVEGGVNHAETDGDQGTEAERFDDLINRRPNAVVPATAEIDHESDDRRYPDDPSEFHTHHLWPWVRTASVTE